MERFSITRLKENIEVTRLTNGLTILTELCFFKGIHIKSNDKYWLNLLIQFH